MCVCYYDYVVVYGVLCVCCVYLFVFVGCLCDCKVVSLFVRDWLVVCACCLLVCGCVFVRLRV